jgi:arylsulfatase A-like enzyme
MSAAITALTAALVALGLDLGLAGLGGYRLRSDAWAFVALDLLGAGAAALGVLGALRAASSLPPFAFLRRAPRTSVLVAAAAPAIALRVLRTDGLIHLIPDIALVAVIGLVLAYELARRPAPPRPVLAVGAALVFAAAVAAAALRPPAPPGRLTALAAGGSVATPEAPNLLVIVLDTLRADHVGAYGYARDTTPFLDSFAASATLFERAFSSSAFTLPSHASLFTGLYPATHRADVSDDATLPSLEQLGRLNDTAPARPLSRDAVTLAEVARDGGLETGAVCANTAYLYAWYGLDQGFDSYVDTPGQPAHRRPLGLSLLKRLGGWRVERLLEGNERYSLLAWEVNDFALRWLEPRRERRFFLFLNYMEPHEPYLPLPAWRDAFPRAWDRQQVDRGAIRERERAILPDERDPLVDAYDASALSLDHHLRLLFERLEQWQLLDRSLVVITSDHGESFGEHNDMGHCNNVYQPEVHVPLLVREPGQREGRRVREPVSLVDVMPTLLARAKLPAPPGLQGTDLFGGPRALPLVASMGRYLDLARSHPRFYDRTHEALVRERWKLVRHSSGERELYDLDADPGELADQAAARPDVARELLAELERFDREATPRFASDAGGVDPEALERLRRLGYAN